VEFVTDRVGGQPCDYVHRTVIIANMCNFIWAGNKPPRVAGNVTCCTVHECEKWVSRYAQEVDVFCIITLFLRPMSWFRLQKVKTAGNKLTDGPRSTSVCTRISTVVFFPPLTPFCKQLKTCYFLANKIGNSREGRLSSCSDTEGDPVALCRVQLVRYNLREKRTAGFCSTSEIVLHLNLQ